MEAPGRGENGKRFGTSSLGLALLASVLVLPLALQIATGQQGKPSVSSLVRSGGAVTGLPETQAVAGLTLLTTETYSDFVRVEERLTLVLLFYSTVGEPDAVRDAWLGKVLQDSRRLSSGGGQRPLHVALVDVSVDRMMVTLVPAWLRRLFGSQGLEGEPNLHIMLTRGDGAHGVVLRRWTGMWGKLRLTALAQARAIADSPLVHRVVHGGVSDMHAQLSGVSAGKMLVTASCSSAKDTALVESVLHELARRWGARGAAVDQPGTGVGDGVLPTLVLLPNNHSIAKGQTTIKVLYSSHPGIEPAAEWTISLASKDAILIASDILTRLLSLGCDPLVDASLGWSAVWTYLEGVIKFGWETKTRYIGLLACDDWAGDVLSPGLHSLLLRHRQGEAGDSSIGWLCVPPPLLMNKDLLPKKAQAYWAEHGEEGHHPRAAIFDSQPFWYTGPDVVLVFAPSPPPPSGTDDGMDVMASWSDKREWQKLGAAIEYMITGDRQARALYRKKGLEKLSTSVESFVKWMLKLQDEGNKDAHQQQRMTYSDKDMKRVFRFMDVVGFDMDLRRDVAHYMAKSDLRGMKQSQLALLRQRLRDEGSMEIPALDHASPERRKKMRPVLRALADVIAKRDRLCVAMKRGRRVLQKVLREVEACKACSPAEYEDLRQVLRVDEGDKVVLLLQCDTFVGFYDEEGLLAEIRAKGTSLVQDLAARLMESSRSLLLPHLQAAKDHAKDTAPLADVFAKVLREAEAIQQELESMTEAGNRAARDFLKTQPRPSSWQDAWPFPSRLQELPRREASRLTLEEFSAYAEEGTPVVITGLDMAPHGLWNSTYIKSACGSVSLGVGEVKQQLRHMRAWGGFTSANYAPMTLGELVEAQASRNASTDGWYMADESVQKRCSVVFGPPPFGGLRVPHFIGTDYLQLNNHTDGGYPIHGPSAFCGAKGTGTALHEDAGLTGFWMFMMSGEKHWRMFKPMERLLLYHDEDLQWFGPGVFDLDLDQYPLTAFADIFEVRLQPGELLFAPSGSIHAVRNTGDLNYGLSTNYADEWGMAFAFLHHLVLDSEEALAYHMEQTLALSSRQPHHPPNGTTTALLGRPNSDLRTVTNAWQDQHYHAVEPPTTSVPYGVFRSQSRRYGRDRPLKDALARLLLQQRTEKPPSPPSEAVIAVVE